ncbi:hypothetical protein M0802_001378 [Mischocyttarus mexicanus]|nr:hypothetical protein M0802_001378 [Mischocyttarus mexicanus]
MEYQNKTLLNTSKKQQVAVISKLQNMQWLKKKVPLPGYVKSRQVEKGVDNLKDLESVKLTHTNVNNNIELSNSIDTIFITHDSKCDFEIETDVTEKSVVSTNALSTWNLKNKIENSSSLSNKQELDLKKLEGKEVMNMTNSDSLIIQNFEIKCKLNDKEKGNCSTLSVATKDTSQNATVRNQVPLKVQDNKNKPNQTNSDEKNNNLTSIKKLNSKSGTQITTLLKKDNSNNINLNQQNSPDPLCTTKKEIYSLNLSKISNFTGKFKKIHDNQNVTVDNKLKNEMKDSCKYETAVINKKPQDNKDHQSNQSTLNISKELKSTSNLQSKKESDMKYTTESTSRCVNKNIKENEQNKTTISNNVNRQSKVNRVNTSYRKTENKFIPKAYNDSSETTQYSMVKEKKNQSTQLNITAQPFNIQEECSKSENTKPPTTMEIEQVAKTPPLKDECITEYINEKSVTNTIKQDTNTSSKEIEKTDGNTTQNFSHNNFVNESIEQKEIYTNPSSQDLSNLEANTQNIKENVYNDYCDNNQQFNNMYSTNVWHDYKNVQQNIYQPQVPPYQNFIPISDQIVRNCPINTIPNMSHSDVNAVHSNQYGNVPTMQNNSMNPNSMSNMNLPSNAKNVNMMQYQMPNMVPYNNPNLVRPHPSYGAHPMTTPDEQYNLNGYGMNYLYAMNNCPACRNNNYLLLQNWNVPNIYPVPLTIVTNPNQCNCNICCNQLQQNQMIYKNPGVVPQTPAYVRTEHPREQNLQKNYMKPMSKAWYGDNSFKNNEAYNANVPTQEVILNMQEPVDQGQQNQDGEFLNSKETNNLPIISPKDYINYGSSFLTNIKATRPPTKYNEIRETNQSYNFQNKKNNRRSFISREFVPNAKN